MKVNTYLNFGGNCREALDFYAQHLGGKILVIMKHDQIPGAASVPPEWKDAVLHARLALGDTVVMASDVQPGNYQPMRSAYLTLGVTCDAEAERIHAALADGGEIFMPMEETFYATRFSMLRDKFGINWMVIHEKPMPSGA
jgi:PhnB protein